MKSKLFFAVVILLFFSGASAGAAENNSVSALKEMLMAEGFSQLPLNTLGNGFAEQKFYRVDAIFVVNYLLNPKRELVGLAFEFRDDASKGLLINFLDKFLIRLGCEGNLDLLSSLIAARREKGGFYFRCGDITGSVAYANLLCVPLRRIEFLAR